MSNTASKRRLGCCICAFTFAAKPFPETNPNRAAISCNTIVAAIDKTRAHSNSYPNCTPASVQTVTVPGPINAAATKVPGPIFLKGFFKGVCFAVSVLKILFSVGSWIFVVDCWMLDAGCWMLDAGCWMLEVGSWVMLVAGCWKLDAGCWMLEAESWVMDADY